MAKGWNKVEGWEFRQAFCRIWVEDGMVWVTIDGWGIDHWYCEAKSEEEFYKQCREYLKSERFTVKREALRGKAKCPRCKGKGGFQQLTGVNEDDVAWDLCPECGGTGIREDD